MAEPPESESDILKKIQDVYIPFLKKLLAHMGKKKDSQPKTYEKLTYVYKNFTEADKNEKLTVYNACKDMIERWYKRYKDMKSHQSEKKSQEASAANSEDSQQSVDNPPAAGKTQKSAELPLAIVSVVSCSDTQKQTSKTSHKSFTERQDGVYFQDEIEIEQQSDTTSYTVLPGATGNAVTPTTVVNIKKEKEDLPKAQTTAASTTYVQQPPSTYGQPQVSYTPPQPPQTVQRESLTTKMLNMKKAQEAEKDPEPQQPKEVTFVCASCQFRTTDEVDFMKHARTDHRTDLSLWCKQCGKCFSNAGVLVSHIKEASCQKEDMIYRCGVKDCTFETPSGQTFVHHLRHCHKGSPFIFCIHCQKIFTLPHCLILHMQNECPFKDKNRRNPEAAAALSAKNAAATPTTNATTPIPILPKPSPVVRQVTPVTNAVTPVNRNEPVKSITPAIHSQALNSAKKISRNRGRGRGRTSRHLYSESSDSDDPDDPSWKPEESLNSQPLRRSARWAKKVVEAKDPELDPESLLPAKKSKTIVEEPSKILFCCPCCDFSASFESLLHDHYKTDHKHIKRNACLVCNVKFENFQLFIEHFSLHHENEKKSGNKLIGPGESQKTNGDQNKSESDKTVAQPSEIPIENVPGQYNIIERDKTIIKIPYQTAIHEKLLKESKIKLFDELKSPADIEKMKTETKLKHFFKCVVYNCTYTTDDKAFYVSHMDEHKGKKMHCAYCFHEYYETETLADHMLKEHGRRCYQCSICFYRAFSKPHVQIHMKKEHPNETIKVHTCSSHLPTNFVFPEEKETEMKTTWPYVCAIGDCKYQTFDPKEFKKHNDISHRSVSVFFCYYCKVDFISFKRLMAHYHLHGINNFQCTYCVHGSDTRDEILYHLCNSHADRAFKVHVRAQQDANATNKTNAVPFEANSAKTASSTNAVTNSVSQSPAGHKIATNIPVEYPKNVASLEQNFFCRMIYCGVQCADLNSYLNHVKETHNALNILCPYCSCIAESGKDFQNHLLCHGPNLYACASDGCSFSSANKSTVADHQNSVHQLKNTAVKTVRFSDTVLQPESLKLDQLLYQKMENGTQTFICPFCYYQCASQSMMKTHIYLELAYKRFLCNLCKVRCCSRKETSRHFSSLHTHHNIKCVIESNPEIEFLVKNYLSPKISKLVREYFQNEGYDIPTELKFSPENKCDRCSLSFGKIVDWQHHLLYCLSRDFPAYICNHCGAKSPDLSHVKYHANEVHPDLQISFTTVSNSLHEQQMGRKLQQVRLSFLKDMITPLLDGKDQIVKDNIKLYKFETKYYKCGYCKFNDNFRSNIEKHVTGCHKNKPMNVEKVKRDLSKPQNFSLSVEDDESSNGSTASKTVEAENAAQVKRYLCNFCTKKAGSLTELDAHVASYHPEQDVGSYPYFYWPDPDAEYSVDDKEFYECAYCSVSQENLYHLKRHCSNLHSAAAFKVRGIKAKAGSLIKCDYCDSQLVSEELLEKHCRYQHPKMPLRSDGGTKAVKRKGSDVSESESDAPVKKRANVDEVSFRCIHCSLLFPFYMKLLNHHKSAHPGMTLSYEKACGGTTSNVSEDITLVPCDFCPFIGEQKLLDEHVAFKHKNSVICGHCDKSFESLPKLEEHNETEHKEKPTSIIKVNPTPISFIPASVETSSESSEPILESHYGKKPEPIDNSITVNIVTNDGVWAKLPLIYLNHMFKLYPKIYLKDFQKQ